MSVALFFNSYSIKIQGTVDAFVYVGPLQFGFIEAGEVFQVSHRARDPFRRVRYHAVVFLEESHQFLQVRFLPQPFDRFGGFNQAEQLCSGRGLTGRRR